IEIGLPVPIHGRPLQKPTSYESPKTPLGNPESARPPKICQSSVRRKTSLIRRIDNLWVGIRLPRFERGIL
ncbi:hypothetical protein, partial [Allomesorhizobium camelthorni]|uniref:hypothetical protein n=1 Tax=Allomesorhizobium camelthorni TaxID=475069 RepID=UPI00197F474F